MNLLHLFQISYYFDSFSGTIFPGFWVAFGVLVAIFLVTLGFGIKWGQDKSATGRIKEARGKWLSLGYAFSIIGLGWLFFRYQGIPYFNWRLWPVALVIAAIVRVVMLWRTSRARRAATQAHSGTKSGVSVAEYTRRRRTRKK